MRAVTAGLLLSFALWIGVGPWVSASRAQVGTDRSAGEQQVHTYARPGQETITLYVWGAVNQPGVWNVAPKTGLVELFSVIQPRGYGVESPATDTDVVVRIHRTRDGETRLIEELEVAELLEMRPAERPQLQGEDVIEVRTIENRTFGLSLVGTIVGTLSSLSLLVLRLLNG
jgi:hypothetical protein